MGELIEEVRVFLTQWALAIAAILGLVVAWRNAKDTIYNMYKHLNLYQRIHKVEKKVHKLIDGEECNV